MSVAWGSLAVPRCGEAVPSVSSDVCAPGGLRGKDPACQCRRRRRGGLHGAPAAVKTVGRNRVPGSERRPAHSSEMATHSSVLAWKIPWTEKPGWLQSGGLRESATAEHAWGLIFSRVLCLVFSSVQFSRSVVSDSLGPHESQHARPRCPSSTPGVHSDSRPSSQ